MKKYDLFTYIGNYLETDIFVNIIRKLESQELLEIPEEYWIYREDGSRYMNYSLIEKDFNKLAIGKYVLEEAIIQ